MSSNSSSIVFPVPPPGMAYIAEIIPSLNLLILGATWSAALVPLLITLFIFSNAKLRRSPIFFLNVVSVLLGIIIGIFNYYIEVRAIIEPSTYTSAKSFIIWSVLFTLIPMLVEAVLVVRVYAVYPPRTLSWLVRAGVYLPIIVMKLARLINVCIAYSVFFSGDAGASLNPIVRAQGYYQHPYIKIELFLQVFDNAYVSFLFLRRLRESVAARTGQTDSKGRGSYMSRLRSLFWISVSNFVFPVMLSIAEIITAFIDKTYLNTTYVMITNIYVGIIGVLLATVWCSGASSWLDSQDKKSSGNSGSSYPQLSAPRFAGRSLPGSNVFSSTGSTEPQELYVSMERSIQLDNLSESDASKHTKFEATTVV